MTKAYEYSEYAMKRASVSPKVAVVMAGEVRTLPFAASNLEASLLRPLQADLYMDVSLGGRKGPVISAQLWLSTIRLLRPTHLWVGPGEPANASTYHGLFTRWRRLLDAVESHEREQQMRYTWVLRTRPDLLYTCRMTPQLLANNRGRALLKWDLFAAFPRDTAAVALAIGSQTRCPCQHAIVDLCIPGLLHRHKLAYAQARSMTVVTVFSQLPSGCGSGMALESQRQLGRVTAASLASDAPPPPSLPLYQQSLRDQLARLQKQLAGMKGGSTARGAAALTESLMGDRCSRYEADKIAVILRNGSTASDGTPMASATPLKACATHNFIGEPPLPVRSAGRRRRRRARSRARGAVVFDPHGCAPLASPS